MQRNTSQRRNILEIIRQEGHATLPEIEEKLLASGEKMALSTIYRNLSKLESENIVRKIPIKSGDDFYEFYEQEKHDHFICLKCGKIVDIPKKKTNIKSLEKEGKSVEEVVTIYYGLCDDCNKCM